MAITAFTRSPFQAFTRSPFQARNRQIASASTFRIVLARQPLYGFGTFNASSTYGNPQFDDVWPQIYNHMVETWTDGPGYSRTTTYSQYWDIIQTITGSPSPHYVSTISQTITPTLFTVNYSTGSGSGVYTAQLGGTLLNDSSAGPFNLTDATYGWAALTGLSQTILDSVSFPGGANQWNFVLPISTSPGYEIGSITSPPSSDIILAAAYGYPVRSWGGQSMNGIPGMPSIVDYFQPYNALGAFTPNWGAALCAKSIWNLNGSMWSYGGATTDFISTDHTALYLQRISALLANGGISVPSNIGGAPFSNGMPWPSIGTFLESDIPANAISGFPYGMLGFLNAAS